MKILQYLSGVYSYGGEMFSIYGRWLEGVNEVSSSTNKSSYKRVLLNYFVKKNFIKLGLQDDSRTYEITSSILVFGQKPSLGPCEKNLSFID